MVILIGILIAGIILGLVYLSRIDPIELEKVNSFRTPKVFYADYNKICLKIYQMTRQTEDDVMHEIHSFEDKYGQIIDKKIYHETMANLLDTYRKRHFFLNK